MLNKNERGSIMVEVLAVIALMGLMGTVLYRQIQHRNEELDNINMASEIRMVKEATTAYIQDHRATLEQMEFCTDAEVDYTQVNVDDIDGYMPTNWACDVVNGQPNGNCLINEFTIWLACDPVGTGDRKMIWGLVVPNAENLPQNFNLRRAARVANLIGADGGIHEPDDPSPDGMLYGTQGAWEDACGEPCNGRKSDAFYVATTGMDVYIPEVEASAANAVAIPNSLALNTLHSNSYFSVGKDFNCVGNYDTTADRYAHEDLINNVAAEDTILRVGGGDDPNSLCDPLFWVGVKGPDPDHSDSNHVYVKNNLYVGRDNAHQRQAIALETGDDNTSRQIVVYDKDGVDTLTLNADGQIIGRTNETTGQGYLLDAKTGEMMLFDEQEVTLTINGEKATAKVRLPGLRLTKDGKILTGVFGSYYDGANKVSAEYGVDPAGTSLMNDVRLTSRGGAKLSEILPDYIAKGIKTMTQPSDPTNTVDKPTCPKGYVRAITVTPVKYSQYVKSITINPGATGDITNGSAGSAHTHSIASVTASTLDDNTKGLTDGAGKLTLTQFAPVTMTIEDVSGEEKWRVTLKYGTDNPSSSDPISALVQTYCVYTTEANAAEASTSFKRDERTEPMLMTTCTAGTAADVCVSADDCVDNVCQAKKCAGNNGTSIAGNIYCIGGRQVYVECLTTAQCGEDKLCSTDYRCVDAPTTPEPEPEPEPEP